MSPLSFEALEAAAIAAGSVNVEHATPWNLRWYDPFFCAIWERFSAAKAVWDRTWPTIDFKYMRGTNSTQDGTLWPDVTLIPAGPSRVAAVEYLAAKAAYHASRAHYPNTRPS